MTETLDAAIQQFAKAGALSTEDATRIAEQARSDFNLMGVDADDMDAALVGALALATQEVPRKRRRIWPYITGLTAAAVCFAYATWAVITATAAW